ncbi:N-6 DNA Methylase [Canicola haemoglobinophilus]|nr:N-6 DNA Methylase [Canicola haemoglobinophilus]
MNPPYGGSEIEQIKMNFPAALRSSETADLFMSVIMYRLKKNGRVAIVLPDGFLFGTDNAKMAIKQKLMNEMNLHTVIRLPHSVFAPYTSITTNILFLIIQNRPKKLGSIVWICQKVTKTSRKPSQ